jgi:hypothetical protein
MPAGSVALVALPPLFREGDGCVGWHPVLLRVSFYYQSAIAERSCITVPIPPVCSMLLWKHGMEDHWAIAHPDHQSDERVAGHHGTADAAMITAAAACPEHSCFLAKIASETYHNILSFLWDLPPNSQSHGQMLPSNACLTAADACMYVCLMRHQ